MSLAIDKSRNLYKKIIVIELFLSFFLSLLVYLFKPEWRLSFLLGCSVAWVSQCCFVIFLFYRQSKLDQSERIKALYQAEALKMTIVIVFLSILLINFKAYISLKSFFVGYLILIIVNSFLPLILSKSKS